jgi:hypothetical protein
MFTHAEVTLYDCFTDVVITARVKQHDGLESPVVAYETFSSQVKGTGEDNPRKWLRDALMDFIETL